MSLGRYDVALRLAKDAGGKSLDALESEISDAVARYREDALVTFLQVVGPRLLKNPSDSVLCAKLSEVADMAAEARPTPRPEPSPEFLAAFEAAWAKLPESIRVEGPTEADYLELRLALRSEDPKRLEAILRTVVPSDNYANKRGPKYHGDAVGVFCHRLFTALYWHRVPVRIYNENGGKLDQASIAYMFVHAVCEAEAIDPPGEKTLRDASAQLNLETSREVPTVGKDGKLSLGGKGRNRSR